MSQAENIRRIEQARERLAFAAAILHTFDLDGLEALTDRLASPQALLDGFPITAGRSAEHWLEMIRAARELRERSSFDAEVLAATERQLTLALTSPDDPAPPEAACPSCGERRIDALAIQADGSVNCGSCGCHYLLSGKEDHDADRA